MDKVHRTVLKKEAVDLLNVKNNRHFVDCTVGEGGHTEEILKRNGPRGKVLGFEWDKRMYERVRNRNLERLDLVNESYVFLKKTVEEKGFGPISGILLDLGMSTWHIKKSKKGFSFQGDEPLDMRYNTDSLLTAREIVNEWKKENLIKLIKNYSNERYAEKIVNRIIKSRPLKSTKELVEAIKKSVPDNYEKGRIHPATRTFQALRIAVNAEVQNLKEVLPQAFEVLKPGGKIVVISFHHLEGEEVENFFKKEEGLLSVAEVTPSKEEIKKNPSARSAVLRVAEKISKHN